MKDYTYISAFVKAKETALLSEKDIEQLINADSDEAERVLREREHIYREDILSEEEALDILRLPVDYHNIKAAVKSVFSDIDASDALKDGGTADKTAIYEAVKSDEYNGLPEHMADTAKEAMTLLRHTQNGQLCDIFIDKALLQAQYDAAEKSGDSFIIGYARLLADILNLKTALRCVLCGKSASFIENALCGCGGLNIAGLLRGAENGLDSLIKYVSGTEYEDGAAYMKEGAETFEKWCDERITEYMEGAKYEIFSAAPLIAYAYAREAERKAVHMIVTAKKSGFDNKLIRERVRKLYE